MPFELPETSHKPEEARRHVLRGSKQRWQRMPASVVIGIAIVLAVGVCLANVLLLRPLTRLVQGPEPIYYVTPQGGPPPGASQAQTVAGGPLMLSSPVPPFFLDGQVLRDTQVYRADNGALVQRYLPQAGHAMVYAPQRVGDVLYLAVRPRVDQQGEQKMSMDALRASTGAVLWQWDDCGESDNMSAPLILNGVVYFVCEAAPALYRLYALNASTGQRLWLDTFSGNVGLQIMGDQRAIYLQLDQSILAEDPITGQRLWQKDFTQDGASIDQIALRQGILYAVQGKMFYALKASDGALLWEYRFIGDYNQLQPVVSQSQQTIYLFASELERPATIYALDSVTGVPRWQKPLPAQDYGLPVLDQGNLYLAINVFVSSRPVYTTLFKRSLLAIRGSDGGTLWQQDIPWNKDQLNYSMAGLPALAAGAGRLYLVDWAGGVSLDKLTATLGAFSASDGRLLWTRQGFDQN